MKKVLTAILLILLIGGIAAGVYFRQNIFDLFNDKFGSGETVVIDTYNMENNPSMKPFLDLQKQLMEKKDYKNFLSNINQQVTYKLKEINKIVPGYDNLSNVLFVETEEAKTIDFINMNTYDERFESSYHAFVWVSQPNEINPTWTGYFQENDSLMDSILLAVKEQKVEETQPSTEEHVEESKMTLSEFESTEEYTEIISMLNDEVETEDKVATSMKSTFGDNYDKVLNLLNEAKKSTTLNVSSANMLGENEFGIGYAGKIVDDSFCILTGPLKEDNTIGDTKYLLFRINTNGEYDDYSNGIIMLAELREAEGFPEVVLPSKEVETEEDEQTTTESPTEESQPETVAEQIKQSVEETMEHGVDETKETQPKKSPVDLFDEIMNSSAAEESTTANEN